MGESRRPNPEQTKAKILERLERDQQILSCIRRGKTYHETARLVGCGVTTVVNAHNRILAEARDLMHDDVRMYTAEQLDRLNALLDAVYDGAMEGSVKHVTEARLIIGAIGDFTGSKAPVKHEFGESDVDRALREMDAVFERRAVEAARQAADLEG